MSAFPELATLDHIESDYDFRRTCKIYQKSFSNKSAEIFLNQLKVDRQRIIRLTCRLKRIRQIVNITYNLRWNCLRTELFSSTTTLVCLFLYFYIFLYIQDVIEYDASDKENKAITIIRQPKTEVEKNIFKQMTNQVLNCICRPTLESTSSFSIHSL